MSNFNFELQPGTNWPILNTFYNKRLNTRLKACKEEKRKKINLKKRSIPKLQAEEEGWNIQFVNQTESFDLSNAGGFSILIISYSSECMQSFP